MDGIDTNSVAQHFSRFSINFRVPSDFLGNIGEPLDYSQSERLHQDAPGEREVAAEESEVSAGPDLESAGPVTGSSGVRQEDEDQASVGTADADAGPSVTCWDDDERMNLDSVGPNTGISGTRGDKVGNTSQAPGYMDGTDI